MGAGACFTQPYGEMEELIRIGAYKAGADAAVDEAIRVRPALEAVVGAEARRAFALLRTASRNWPRHWGNR
ncbi:MAG: hypothetical protein WDM79_01485 [Terricaulis sp.]